MCARPIIQVGETEDSLRPAEDQSNESIQGYLRKFRFVRLHLNFLNRMDAIRSGNRITCLWQNDDGRFQKSFPAFNVIAAYRLLLDYRRGNLEEVRLWGFDDAPLAAGVAPIGEEAQDPISRGRTVIPSSFEHPHFEPGSEYLYVLVNDSMPGMVKIGRTDFDPTDRARQLSSVTGVPTAFRIFQIFRVNNATEVERLIHDRLKQYRVSHNREFFAIDPETAAQAIELLVKTPTAKFAAPDRLVDAIQLCLRKRHVWTGMLAGYLGMSYDEADQCIAHMQNLGVIDAQGNANPAWQSSPDAPLTAAEEREAKELPSVPKRTTYHQKRRANSPSTAEEQNLTNDELIRLRFRQNKERISRLPQHQRDSYDNTRSPKNTTKTLLLFIAAAVLIVVSLSQCGK